MYQFRTLDALARWYALALNCAEVRALLGQTNIKDVDMEAVRAGRSRAAEQFALAGQPSHNDLAGILLLTSTRLSSILAYAISLLHTRIRYPSCVPWCQCARCVSVPHQCATPGVGFVRVSMCVGKPATEQAHCSRAGTVSQTRQLRWHATWTTFNSALT
jgi:hypothetical protein